VGPAVSGREASLAPTLTLSVVNLSSTGAALEDSWRRNVAQALPPSHIEEQLSGSGVPER